MNSDSFTLSKYRASIFTVLALPAFYVISRYNYLLFHSLADGVSIVIAACVFTIIWNERHLIDNDYFLYVGITFLFWAFLDFMHLLGNKNMGVFSAYGNLGPAFYIASRYILSISLMIAPLFINRKFNATLMFAAYSLITLLVLLSILYWQIFPVCIIEGVGLTPFKVISDYIICLILLGSIGVMIIKRRSFDSRVLWFIVSSIILSIATGLSFTLYTDPFGIMNMVGHMFQIASFYLIYLALIETSLTKPQDILYRKLKQNEEALRVSEEKYRIAFDTNKDSISINRFADGMYILSNEGFTKTMGFTAADIAGKTSVEINIWENKADRDRLLKGLGRDGKVENLEANFRRKDGVIVRGLMSASVIIIGGIPHIFSVTSDISERKRAEKTLRETNAYLQHLISYANTSIIVWDPQFRITRFNHAFEFLTGRSEVEVIGKTLEMLFPSELVGDSMALIRNTLAGERSETVEIKIQHLDQSVRTVLWNSATLFATDGKTPIATIAQGQDITERKRAEEEISAKNKELESYLYIASHDLRSPLVNIQGFSQRLQKQADSIKTALADCALPPATKAGIEAITDDRMPKTLNFIFSSITKMDVLLNGLLQLSRTGRALMVIKEIDIHQLFQMIIASFNFQLTQLNAIITLKDIPSCYGDENLLNQLFSNIIGNAIKYHDKNRQLVIEITARKEFRKVIYSISDSGLGIESRHLGKIWDIFYRVDSTLPDAGEGLGLNIVRRIAEKHKGLVWVESAIGKGSEFYVELPASEFS